MSKKTDNIGLIAGFWTAVAIAVAMLVLAIIFAVVSEGASGDLALLQADYDALLIEKNACGDGWYEQLELTATLINRLNEGCPARLDECNINFQRAEHDRRWCESAFDNISPYCSEGLDQFVFDGLRAELDACKNQKGLLQHELADALNDRRICKEKLLGAPCHSHYDGLHCTWETCERPG